MSEQPFIGEVIMFAGTFAPRDWAFCDGQLLEIRQHTALFAIIGTTYGGDGRETFGLPDLRGRVPVHAGGSTGPGLERVRLGELSGLPTRTLTVAQLPSHAHGTQVASGEQTTNRPTGGVVPARGGVYGVADAAGPATQAVGGGQPFSVMQPYLGINYIIALTGIFPSRGD